MAQPITTGKLQFVDSNGNPYVGAKLYAFEAGTTTPKDTYKDQAKVATNTNPVILDTAGYTPFGYFGDGSYKFRLDSPDDVVIWTVDNINIYALVDWTGLTATVAEINAVAGTTLSKTADYTVLLGDRGKTILCDATTGAITIDLLAAATATDGYYITIKKTDTSTNIVTIDGNTTETVDDQLTFTLSDYNDSVKLRTDGSNWFIVSKERRGTIKTLTATDTLTLDDDGKVIECDCSAGNIIVNLPTAASAGGGFQFYVKKTDSTSNSATITPQGVETIDGSATKAIQIKNDVVEIKTDASNWFIISEYGAQSSFPDGYIVGLEIRNDADADHDIFLTEGKCRGKYDTFDIIVDSNYSKQIDNPWAAGTAAGGFPSTLTGGLVQASTWYHFFVIAKHDGTVDAGFDSSLTATNLLADATDYIYYRRVGSVLTDGSANIIAFNMMVDLYTRIVYWDVVPGDADLTNPGTGLLTTTLSVPPDINIKAMLNVYHEQTGGVSGFYSLFSPFTSTVTINNFNHLTFADPGSAIGTGYIEWLTNTSSQIRGKLTASDANTILRIGTFGWIEN